MFHVKLSGTAKEMGQQHGAMLKHAGVQLPVLNPKLNEIAKDCEIVLKELAPEYHAEVTALAQSANLNPETVLGLLLAAPLEHTIPSCSVIAVTADRSVSGETIVGRNYDWLFNPAKYTSSTYDTEPSNGYAHIGNCDWWVGREDGLNEKGLFVAMSATFLPGVQAGLPFWFIVRMLLERCATVAEGISLLESVPHSQSRNYMLVDKIEAVVAEASIHGITLRYPHNGVLTMTNHPITPALQETATFIPEDSFVRYACLAEFANHEQKISENDLKSAMRNRETGIWAEHPVFEQDYGTIWSAFASPAEKRIEILADDNTGTYISHNL